VTELKTDDGRRRIVHLDTCRGIAASMVVASHCLQTVDVDRSWNALRAALGHYPVLFFFVLSGYVLGRPLARRKIDLRFYSAYAVKRFFRLIPLLVAVFLFAFFVAKGMDSARVGSLGISQWAVNLTTWMAQVTTPGQLWENLLLVQRGLNVPTWTIKIEIVCSMLLPAVVLLTSSNRFLMVCSLVGLCFFGSEQFSGLFGLEGSDMTLFESSRYLYLFLLGFLLCRFDGFFSDRRKGAALIVLVVFLSSLVLTLWIFWGDNLSHGFVMAGILAVLIPLPFPGLKRILESRVPLLIGELSYGIYLLHTPILLLLLAGPVTPWFGGGEGAARFPALFLQVFVLTIVFSFIANRLIELPLNRLGHILASRISGSRPQTLS
jgi:peptidoglycan/LPS O-acetylase OafA/YrhL